jgi:Protein of unknown function (DUF664)
MATDDPKDVLIRYLTAARDGLLWKLDGLSEYDVRRPLTPTGTNLLGLVKHVGSVAAGYFGDCFDRPFPEPLPWFDDGAEPNADLWATADESREYLLGLYERCWAHADATIASLPLDATGTVPWWGEERRHPTLHTLLVHMIAETNRHLGHADIVRETIDGAAGARDGASNLPDFDADDWSAYYAKVDRAARDAG